MKKINYLLVMLVLFVAGCNINAEQSHNPKNVIVFVADGWGFNHMLAADYYEYGKTGKQPFQKFPVQLAAATYMTGGSYDTELFWSDFEYAKKSYTDSAAAATALSAGQLTRGGRLNIDPQGEPVFSMTEHFTQLNRSTGVISDVQISHATPAGFVAHNISRNNYSEIANEMIFDSGLNVIMGAGHPYYRSVQLPANPGSDFNYEQIETFTIAETPDFQYVGGQETWKKLKNKQTDWTLIESRDDFIKLQKGQTPDRVIGIAKAHTTLQQSRGGSRRADAFVEPFNAAVPTLEDMTLASLNILSSNEQGFFLMVEGGAIDWAGHSNQSGRVIEEMIAFNAAVEAAVQWVQQNSSWKETLIIVTADHECGYLTGIDADKEPYFKPITNNGKGKMPGMQFNSGSHTNALVPLFAKGPGSAKLKEKIIGTDKVYGDYIHLTDIAKTIKEITSPEKE